MNTAGGTQFFASELGIVVTLLLQCIVALKLPRSVAVVVWSQAVFWLLSSVARAVYLWTVQPSASEVLYDVRFARIGYHNLLDAIMPVILVGNIAFLVAISLLALVLPRRLRRPKPLPLWQNANTPLLLRVLVALGWAGRVVGYFNLSGGLSAFGVFSAFAVPAYIVFAPVDTRRLRSFAGLLIAGELTWSVIDTFKTPALTITICVVIRLVLIKGPRVLLIAGPLAAVAVSSIFLVIQPLRGIDTANDAIQQDQSAGAALAATVLERTDVLTPVADAYLYPTRPWLSAREYFDSTWTGLIPTGIHESVGVLWTQDVKSRSVTDQYQQVFIAAGTTAEGYAQSGLAGVVIESTILAAITAGLGLGLSSRSPLVAIPFAAQALDSSMYEGGLLWISEGGAAIVQTFLICVVLRLVQNSLKGRGKILWVGSDLQTVIEKPRDIRGGV